MWFLFLFSTNDVSTLNKKTWIVETLEWMSKTREKRSTIDVLIEFSSLITINWLTSRTERSTIDWDVVQADSLVDWLEDRRSTVDWLIDSKIEDRLLIRCRSSKLIKRIDFEQKIDNWVVSWRFFLLFHSRRRHASWSLSKRTSHSDDFILNTRVLLRAMKILFLLAYFYEQLTIFFLLAYFYERSDDLI